jgi:hypothetical protein
MLIPFTGSEIRVLFIQGDGVETTLKPLLLQNPWAKMYEVKPGFPIALLNLFAAEAYS